MLNGFMRASFVLIFAFSSIMGLAAEDFDCYSEDNAIVFAGKTMERNGVERFISGLNVWINGKKVARISNEDLGHGEDPYHFTYAKKGIKINFDWEGSRSVTMKYAGDENGVGAYQFAGKLICE